MSPSGYRVACAFVACYCSIGTAPSVRAQGTAALDIHGFGGWAAGYTSNNNTYGDIASNNVEYDNYYFTLNLLARPTEKVLVLAQPSWKSDLRGQRVYLALAYVDWTFARDTRLRAGKIKNPLGVYTEIFDVGTLRPFYLLPLGVYNTVPEGYTGVGLNRLQRFGEWELELDLLGGKMHFEPFTTDAVVGFDPSAKKPIYASPEVESEGRDVIGGGALLRLPVKGLKVGINGYTLRLYTSIPSLGLPLASAGAERTKSLSASVEYVTDRLCLRAEGFNITGVSDFQAAYGEAAYKLDAHWQVAALYDWRRRKNPPPIVDTLGDHQSLGVGLNYWVSPKMVYKLNYYHVSGNHFAREDNAVTKALAGTLKKDTDVVVGGVHFSF